MTSHRKRAYLYLILVALIWGAAGPIIKFTLGGIAPLPFLAYRFTISAFFAILYFSISGFKLPKPKSSLLWVIGYGLLAFTIALVALFTGLDKSTVLDLALIATIGPLIVTFGGAIIYHDHITHREKIGIFIVLIGALINSIVPFLFRGSSTQLTGNLFIFIYLLADVSAVLLAKRAVQNKIPAATLTNMGFIVGALTIIPLALILHGSNVLLNSIISLPLKYHLGVWYMALLSGTVAYYLYIRGQKSIEVSEATLFSYLQPVFAIPLAVFWLGESITATFIVGAILITTGIIIAEYKKKSSKFKTNNSKRLLTT